MPHPAISRASARYLFSINLENQPGVLGHSKQMKRVNINMQEQSANRDWFFGADKLGPFSTIFQLRILLILRSAASSAC